MLGFPDMKSSYIIQLTTFGNKLLYRTDENDIIKTEER